MMLCSSTSGTRSATASRSSRTAGIGQRPATPSAIVSMRSVSTTDFAFHDNAIAGAPLGRRAPLLRGLAQRSLLLRRAGRAEQLSVHWRRFFADKDICSIVLEVEENLFMSHHYSGP